MACHSAAAEALPSSTLARRVVSCRVPCTCECDLYAVRDSWISLTDVSVLCLSFLAVPRRAPRARVRAVSAVTRVRRSDPLFAVRGAAGRSVRRAVLPRREVWLWGGARGLYKNRSRSAQFDLCSSFRIALRPHPLHAASGASSRAWRWPPQLYTRRAARGGSARHNARNGATHIRCSSQGAARAHAAYYHSHSV